MCGVAGIVMLARFNSVRVGHGESYLLITVLACFLGRVDPFGGFGRVLPVAIALVILQVIASGLNLLGANQHLSTALWGGFLLLIMVARSIWASQFPADHVRQEVARGGTGPQRASKRGGGPPIVPPLTFGFCVRRSTEAQQHGEEPR